MPSTDPRQAFFGATVREVDLPWVRLVETLHPPGQELPWHEHGRPYVTFVGSGGYREEVAGGSTDLGAGSVVLHPGGERHRDRFWSRSAALLNVELGDGAIDSLGAAAEAFERRVVIAGPATRPWAAKLRSELRFPDSLTPIVVEGALLEIAAASLRQARRRHREPPWLEQVEGMLSERFAQGVTLAELAGAAGVHPHHLARAFRRHRGASVGGTLRRLRAERGAELLRGPLPLAEVALRVGFSDQSHFTRCFGRVYGTTPGAYRRRVRGGRA